MKFVLPGGSGQVGMVLARALAQGGHDVVVLSRNGATSRSLGSARAVAWDACTLGPWADEIDGADVVINLAGSSVSCRYTPANRRSIMESRVESTRVIGQAIAHAARPPRVWLQASTCQARPRARNGPDRATWRDAARDWHLRGGERPMEDRTAAVGCARGQLARLPDPLREHAADAARQRYDPRRPGRLPPGEAADRRHRRLSPARRSHQHEVRQASGAGQACASATPQTASEKFVKRIVAGPGDRISIRQGHVIRNGERASEGFITPCGNGEDCNLPRTLTVAAGRYYLLGDNRGNSHDSRNWGPVPARSMIGPVQRLGP